MFSEGFYISHYKNGGDKIMVAKIDYSVSLLPGEVLSKDDVQRYWEDSTVKFTDHAQRRYMFGF